MVWYWSILLMSFNFLFYYWYIYKPVYVTDIVYSPDAEPQHGEISAIP